MQGMDKVPASRRSAVYIDNVPSVIQERGDLVRMLSLVLFDNVPGVVRGVIFANDQLVLKICVLHEYTVDRLGNPPFMVVGHQADADLHLGFPCWSGSADLIPRLLPTTKHTS